MSNKLTMPQTLPEFIRNDYGLYEGNLGHYYRTLFKHAQNLEHPYHNFRHMFHVMVFCYKACLFYHEQLSARQMRNLLIATIFHDFNHTGLMGDDDLNIERALRGLRKHIAPVDAPHLDEIARLVQATQFPHVIPDDQVDLCGQILRDADLVQAMSTAWVQQVVFGLAREWGKKPIEVLEAQSVFHRNLHFRTEWAQQEFPQSVIDAKIKEAKELRELLDEPPQHQAA